MTEVIRSKPANSEELAERKPPFENMVWIPGGTFRMGSEDFYPQERPVHEVTAHGFWMDSYVVTNAQFTRFVEATGYVTLAERPLNPADFPGAPPENLVPGSMLFHNTAGAVDLRNYANWWAWAPGTSWRHPLGPGSSLEGIEQQCRWRSPSMSLKDLLKRLLDIVF